MPFDDPPAERTATSTERSPLKSRSKPLLHPSHRAYTPSPRSRRAGRRPRSVLTLLVTLVMLFMLAGASAAGYVAWELGRPLQPGDPSREFKVAKGKSLSAVAEELQQQGFLRHDWTFRVLHRLSVDKAPIQAGTFAISAARSPSDIFRHLRFGQPVLRQYTIREGLTLVEIGRTLEADSKGALHAEELLALTHDKELARSLGVDQPTLEGYLLPETYSFPDETPLRKIVEVMVQGHFKALPADYAQREAALGLTHHQLVTLASLVEAETPRPDEKAMVAEVFYQRHKKGMLLQCDPTTVYGVTDFQPPITKKDLQREHAYNTYLHPGLPPGPINNPGKQALLAALAPASEGNLYFVARADGSRGHFFSKTLSEHNRSVAIYRKRLQATQGAPPPAPAPAPLPAPPP